MYIKINQKFGSYMLDSQEAKLIIEVLNYGMPNGEKKRMKLAKLDRRLKDKFEIICT